MKARPILDMVAIPLLVIALANNFVLLEFIICTYATIIGAIEIKKGFNNRIPATAKKYLLIFPIVYIVQIAICYSVNTSGICSLSNPMGLIWSGILAPIREEYLFRVIPSKFKSSIIYYLISVLLFSYLHVMFESPVLILAHVFTAILFAVSYRKTKDIRIPILLHICNNVLCLL